MSLSEESRRALLLRLIRPIQEGDSDSLELRGRSLEQGELPTEIRRLRGLRSLRCDSLRRIPSWICELEHLETLDLSGYRMGHIPPEIGGLVRLRTLKLSGAGGPIPAEIRRLVGLRELAIRGHEGLDLARMPPARFHYGGGLADLAELESLELSENSLDTFPPGIGELKKLRRLCLRHNCLELLPSEVAGLENLRILSLTGNAEGYAWRRKGRRLAFPTWIAGLRSLEVLAIGWIGLECFPRDILELERLRVLRLTLNRISALPPDLDRLREIEHLELEGCGFRELPPSIGCLPKLGRLVLDDNELERMPDISGLANLELLRLGGNRLLELPPGIGALHRLRVLLAWRNQITRVPMELAELPNLADLNLSGNPLAGVHPELMQLFRRRGYRGFGFYRFDIPTPAPLGITGDAPCDV